MTSKVMTMMVMMMLISLLLLMVVMVMMDRRVITLKYIILFRQWEVELGGIRTGTVR